MQTELRTARPPRRCFHRRQTSLQMNKPAARCGPDGVAHFLSIDDQRNGGSLPQTTAVVRKAKFDHRLARTQRRSGTLPLQVKVSSLDFADAPPFRLRLKRAVLPKNCRLCVGRSIWSRTGCGSKRVISLKPPGRYRNRFRTALVYSTFWAKPKRAVYKCVRLKANQLTRPESFLPSPNGSVQTGDMGNTFLRSVQGAGPGMRADERNLVFLFVLPEEARGIQRQKVSIESNSKPVSPHPNLHPVEEADRILSPGLLMHNTARRTNMRRA